MISKSRLTAWLVSLLAGGALLVGCVERRFVVTTDPPSAIVYDEKSFPTGASPTDRTFIYYGEYQFTLVRDGYETLVVREKVKAPFYEWFLLDFFSENVIPCTIRDIRRFHYVLQPKQTPPEKAVLDSANALRQRGSAIGVPLPSQPPAAGPVSTTLMPPVP